MEEGGTKWRREGWGEVEEGGTKWRREGRVGGRDRVEEGSSTLTTTDNCHRAMNDPSLTVQ